MDETPWTLERVKDLIADRVQESLHLDYKAAGSISRKGDMNEVSRDISAFANVDGGVIIYGVGEDTKDSTFSGMIYYLSLCFTI